MCECTRSLPPICRLNPCEDVGCHASGGLVAVPNKNTHSSVQILHSKLSDGWCAKPQEPWCYLRCCMVVAENQLIQVHSAPLVVRTEMDLPKTVF